MNHITADTPGTRPTLQQIAKSVSLIVSEAIRDVTAIPIAVLFDALQVDGCSRKQFAALLAELEGAGIVGIQAGQVFWIVQ